MTWDIRITCTSGQHHVYVGLKLHGSCLDADGVIENFALVTEHGFEKNRNMDIYFIVTTKKTISNPIDYWSRNLHKVRCSDLKLLHDHADITHVRLLSRLSARRFCWGFAATKEEVEATANNDDDLLAIMPRAAPLVHEGRLDLAPAVWALMNGIEQPVLLDCEHKWWSDPQSYRFKADITTTKL